MGRAKGQKEWLDKCRKPRSSSMFTHTQRYTDITMIHILMSYSIASTYMEFGLDALRNFMEIKTYAQQKSS